MVFFAVLEPSSQPAPFFVPPGVVLFVLAFDFDVFDFLQLTAYVGAGVSFLKGIYMSSNIYGSLRA